jgi:hypothetical protein
MGEAAYPYSLALNQCQQTALKKLARVVKEFD